jgi:hypothetical protein
VRRLLLLGALAVLGAASAQAATKTHSSSVPIRYLRAHEGGVRAVLSYEYEEPYYREVRLRVTRRGVTRLDVPVRSPVYGPRAFQLSVHDLDADREPEVILDAYTGGAHCCTHSLIYHFQPARHRYRRTFHDWGNVFPPYRIVDPNHDGRPELLSADDRFAYVFTAFAGSFFPVRIWRFDQGRLGDVTRRFPRVVANDARHLWNSYLSFRRTHDDVRGVLAAWLADEELLGRQEEGWARLDVAYRQGELGPSKSLAGWPQGSAYLKKLRSYLRTLGYARSQR